MIEIDTLLVFMVAALALKFIWPETGSVAVRAVILGALMNVSGTLVNAAVAAGTVRLGLMARA